MKIVITGALGHIGSGLLRQLPAAFPGSRIVLIDNMLTQRYCSLFKLPPEGRYQFIETDILKADLPELFHQAGVVIHLAAVTDAASSHKIADQVELVNFQATERVASACAATGSPLIFLSTTSVYGVQSDLVDEDCSIEDLKPQSAYAASKLRAERLLARMSAEDNLRFLTCRFGTISGISPGMRFHTAVNKFCWQAVMGIPLTVWRTALHQKRPYLSLSDGLRAIIFIIRNRLYHNRVYNVLTENLTPDDIVDMIKMHVPEVRTEFTDSAIMNLLSYEVDCSCFKSLGFEFAGSIAGDIAETLALLKSAGGHRGG